MKVAITFIMGLVCMGLSAQNINDVLRYGGEDLQGTARFQAMGGAFGALGGDMSSLNINPAGSAVFNYSQFTITGSNYNRLNEATYGNTFTGTDVNNLEINQAGGVFVFKSPNSAWKKLALGLNYDLAQNFDDDIFINGTTTEGIDNYFLNFAQGVPFGSLTLAPNEFIEDAYLDIGELQGFGDQQAFLGYFGGVINPVDETDGNTSYVSNASYNNLTQNYRQLSTGFNSKFTANFSGQYQDNLYIGASLNFHSIFYQRTTLLEESGFNPSSPVQNIRFDNFLNTEGDGFSFSLGAIAKLNENIRIGGSYQSPTWYRLLDDTSQRINSNEADTDINFIDFDIVNLFEEYRIQIPSKLTGSVAVVFGKSGLISFDYSYQDMSNAELRPVNDPVFIQENDFIANQLGVVNTFRLGGEYRIERFSLRGGYRLEQSPFANTDRIGELTGYSAGLGYDFGGSRLDLAYGRTNREVNQLLFDSGATNAATINRQLTNINLSYTLKF